MELSVVTFYTSATLIVSFYFADDLTVPFTSNQVKHLIHP